MTDTGPLDTERNPVVFTDKEIFTKIWSQPRLIFKYINDNHYDKYTYILLILAAIVRGLHQASTKNMGDKWSLPVVLAISIVFGGLFGLDDVLYLCSIVKLDW